MLHLHYTNSVSVTFQWGIKMYILTVAEWVEGLFTPTVHRIEVADLPCPICHKQLALTKTEIEKGFMCENCRA